MSTTSLPIQFRDATRQQSKASIAIGGLSGTGKSGLALALAYYLAEEDWSKVFGLDTENRSMDLFSNLTLHTGVQIGAFKKYDLLQSIGYQPTHYLSGLNTAIACKAGAYINDSLTHAWTGKGGMLQLVDELNTKNAKINKFSAWGTPEVTEQKNAIYDCIRNSNVHIINTVRMKEKNAMVDEDGKSKIKSLGEQQIIMPDFKYEPDLVIHMESAGTEYGKPPRGMIEKTRYSIFEKGETYEFTETLIRQLVAYLKEGADPAEILEQQRQEYIQAVTEVLDNNPAKQTFYPMLKENMGLKDIALTDMSLQQVRTILTTLIN